ncbi:potassium channel family protein [Rheinheimera baltica]|uniref:Potassium channel family protein n=1 Tax=Rheinheimera baltica TaxID=67576 RepID=A0ABT9HZT9_9GAMM|nr:potassium channel family protein [Rheinheimera baltica]MDP5136626.1 potassium channel family protein [Rheinheimera baltica]MDP5191011.1 potassium channel family protein [Rheinheimera baltica]
MTASSRHAMRHKLAIQLDPELSRQDGLTLLNMFIALVIVVGIVLAVLQTEPMVVTGNEHWFRYSELIFGSIFLLEYLARVWTSVENEKVKSRWHYIFSFVAIADLLAVTVAFSVYLGNGGILLRLLLLIRVLRLARLGRFSMAMDCIIEAVRSRGYELLVSAIFAAALLLMSSTLLYLVEGPHQPEAFGSILRSAWWAVATLTTVGYGDVYPVTALGRVLAGFTAITGVCIIAMPTGILASAFSDAIQVAKERHRKLPKILERDKD